MKRSVLLHSNVLRCVIVQIMLYSLKESAVPPLFSVNTYITFLCYTFPPALSVFYLLLNTNTLKQRRPPHSSLQVSFPRLLLTAAGSHLILSLPLSLSFSHTHFTYTKTHSHCQPHAFIYSLYFLIQFDE